MRPRGWRLDPAWVAHYRAVDEQRAPTGLARLRFDEAMGMMNEFEGKLRALTICESLPGWSHEFIDGKCVFCGILDAPQPSAYQP